MPIPPAPPLTLGDLSIGTRDALEPVQMLRLATSTSFIVYGIDCGEGYGEFDYEPSSQESLHGGTPLALVFINTLGVTAIFLEGVDADYAVVTTQNERMILCAYIANVIIPTLEDRNTAPPA